MGRQRFPKEPAACSIRNPGRDASPPWGSPQGAGEALNGVLLHLQQPGADSRAGSCAAVHTPPLRAAACLGAHDQMGGFCRGPLRPERKVNSGSPHSVSAYPSQARPRWGAGGTQGPASASQSMGNLGPCSEALRGMVVGCSEGGNTLLPPHSGGAGFTRNSRLGRHRGQPGWEKAHGGSGAGGQVP